MLKAVTLPPWTKVFLAVRLFHKTGHLEGNYAIEQVLPISEERKERSHPEFVKEWE